MRGRGRGRGGARFGDRKKEGDKKEKKKVFAEGQGKLTFSEEEQAVLDRLDKGEMMPFHPKVTLDTLTGYGAALATDAPVGQVETVIRNMRLMTGGMAFNSVSGVTADLQDVLNRNGEKLPIFVHSKEEKDWIEKAQRRHRLVPPNAAIKKAFLDTTVLGKHEPAKFADISDVRSTMANYHHRTFTYSAANSDKFMSKVLSLLPKQAGANAAAQLRK